MPFDDYFDRRSGRFASFYKSRPVSRALGRGALFDRLDFAIDRITDVGATRVLDVGCGSGPLFAPLAARGIHVTGIEPAPGMVQLAQQAADGCDGRAEVLKMGWEDLDDWDAGGMFDVAVALGVYDYVPNAGDLLGVMGRKAVHTIASFPSPGLRTNLRRVRYGARGVSVHPYSQERIKQLITEAGMQIIELAPLGRAGHVVLTRNGL